MNTEQQNRLMGSLYRQMMYARLFNLEHSFFIKFPVSSGIKNVLKRMKDNYDSGIAQVKGYMPKTNREFQNQINASDEKVQAIANIIEKLYVLDEADVLRLENDFDSIKIEY